VLREAALELGAPGARADRGGKRPGRPTLDLDSLPFEVHGHQPKANWNVSNGIETGPPSQRVCAHP
jgi:hypothetical protein